MMLLGDLLRRTVRTFTCALPTHGAPSTNRLPSFCNVPELGASYGRYAGAVPNVHGVGGGVKVENPRYINPMHDAYFEAAKQIGLPYNPDFNDWGHSQARPCSGGLIHHHHHMVCFCVTLRDENLTVKNCQQHGAHEDAWLWNMV